MIETIAGVHVPDSRIANDAAELICETTTPLIAFRGGTAMRYPFDLEERG